MQQLPESTLQLSKQQTIKSEPDTGFFALQINKNGKDLRSQETFDLIDSMNAGSRLQASNNLNPSRA